ncbi:MAG: branched-chain amino acid transporter AzlD [Lentisphaerae bacterium]|jgi:branched-subunit amino acid transport protein AzlD|nr:branched-chain amino acid transporter AzlD [Lentisphaerota bacterium]
MNNLDTTYLLAITGVVFAVNYALRGFVFAAFGGGKRPPAVILYVGSVISPAVISMLIVYCLRGAKFLAAPYGVPELTASAVCVVLHLWKRNPLLSIIVSTVVYMVLVQNLAG